MKGILDNFPAIGLQINNRNRVNKIHFLGEIRQTFENNWITAVVAFKGYSVRLNGRSYWSLGSI